MLPEKPSLRNPLTHSAATTTRALCKSSATRRKGFPATFLGSKGSRGACGGLSLVLVAGGAAQPWGAVQPRVGLPQSGFAAVICVRFITVLPDLAQTWVGAAPDVAGTWVGAAQTWDGLPQSCYVRSITLLLDVAGTWVGAGQTWDGLPQSCYVRSITLSSYVVQTWVGTGAPQGWAPHAAHKPGAGPWAGSLCGRGDRATLLPASQG